MERIVSSRLQLGTNDVNRPDWKIKQFPNPDLSNAWEVMLRRPSPVSSGPSIPSTSDSTAPQVKEVRFADGRPMTEQSRSRFLCALDLLVYECVVLSWGEQSLSRLQLGTNEVNQPNLKNKSQIQTYLMLET